MPLFKQHVIDRFQFIYRPINSPGICGLNRNQSGATAMLVIKQGVVEIKQNYAHDSQMLSNTEGAFRQGDPGRVPEGTIVGHL